MWQIMTRPIQFDIRAILLCTTLLAMLLAAWRTGGHSGMCVTSLVLGVVLFGVSMARSSRLLFWAAIVLLLFYLLASLVTVPE